MIGRHKATAADIERLQKALDTLQRNYWQSVQWSAQDKAEEMTQELRTELESVRAQLSATRDKCWELEDAVAELRGLG